MARQALESLILLNLCVLLCSKTPETDITYFHNGIRCVKCAPGTHFIAHCDKEDEDANCRLCPAGTFNSQYNIATSCEPCKTSCELDELVVVANCTHRKDMVCACPDGKFNINAHLDLFHAKCMDYGSCGPGYGVKEKASSERNTTCERCISGRTYSSNTSSTARCQICTDCGNSKIISECNGTHNRICKEEPPVIVMPTQHSDNSPMEIVGFTIGSLAMVSLIAVVILYMCRKQLWSLRPSDPNPSQLADKVSTVQDQYNGLYNNGPGGPPEPSSPNDLFFIKPPSPTDQQVLYDEPLIFRNKDQRSNDKWSGCNNDIMRTLTEELITAPWQRVIRQLYEDSGYTVEDAEREITVEETNNHHNLREQIYHCCSKWSRRDGASPKILKETLLREDCKVIVKVLQEKFPGIFKIESKPPGIFIIESTV